MDELVTTVAIAQHAPGTQPPQEALGTVRRLFAAHADLVEEFERQLIQYEEAHPVIARVISQIITTLNGMGL